jgi:SAM-dependent methyltransferase
MSAGGFTRVDGTVAFYVRINSLLRRDDVVLNLGAGRGRNDEDPVEFRRRLVDLRGKVRRVVAVDPDPAVLDNPLADEAKVMPDEQTIPMPDASCDLVVADWVLEHVSCPRQLGREIARVLRPGGWLCARTPNKWGYIGVGARLVPNRAHSRVLRVLQPDREERDVFPVQYRMNTRAALRDALPGFRVIVVPHRPAPQYLGDSVAVNRLGGVVLRTLPAPLAANLLVFAQRPRTP